MINLQKDQHFLTNREILKKELEISNLTKKDKVIEIGAGNGILTKELVKKAGKVLAFEIDKTLKKDLEKIKNTNLDIIYDSALEYRWNRYNKIVSNIPYSLSEPVILKAIEENIQELILIVSEKFTKTLTKKEKLGIIANLFFTIETIQEVKKEDFNPKPRVNSYLIKLTRRKDKNKIESILRNILLRKGKTKNVIMWALVNHGKTKREAKEIIIKMNIENKILENPIKLISGKFILELREKLKSIS